ncbi:hypothetical protein GCM10022419_098100 [Nonomuraea rosea]|uniref:Uncharacterized protein n=1 Tax=Nonomuraea rosea TaxID=638574 RepID=A0ABP6Z5T9_9ACTN
MVGEGVAVDDRGEGEALPASRVRGVLDLFEQGGRRPREPSGRHLAEGRTGLGDPERLIPRNAATP